MENSRETRQPTRLETVDTADEPRRQYIVMEPRRGPLDVIFRVLAGLAMLVIILMLASLLLVIVGLSSTLGAANASLSSASNAIQQANSAIQGPLQGILGQVQPDRPPPAAVSQGPEFAEIKRVASAEAIGQSGRYILTVNRIVKRDGTTDPNQAQYVVVHRKLLKPSPRMVGPVQVGEDYDEADFDVYKGESFKLGSNIYQANWVSVEDNAAGFARLRNSDVATGPIKFQVE